MRRIVATATSLMTCAVFLWAGDAFGWGSANRWGGSTSHVAGVGTVHTNRYGGSSAHAYGGGTEHTNVYGGRTSGAYGQGATHTYPSGATAYRPPGYPGYPGYPAYHPPVAVPYYSQGCYGCAAAAGAVAGAAVGAAVASANPGPAYVMGTNYATLPPGSVPVYRGGTTYYVNANIWFMPAYGANGVYYDVVPAP
jgi:hypothetical protein